MRKILHNGPAIAVFVLPSLILYSVFVFAGVARGIIGSLYDWDGILPGTFVALANFRRLFRQDLFYLAFKNGLVAVGVLLSVQIILGLFFALVLTDRRILFKKAFRVSYFLPVVMSVSAACILATSVLLPEGGLLNNIFHSLGIAYAQRWLVTPGPSIFAISLVNAWQFMGFFLVIFIAALRSLPPQYHDAAIIDGASWFQEHFRVTIPLLRDVLRFCLLFATLGGLNQFAQNLIITGGGPGTSTYSLTFLMYARGFSANDYGLGCAVATFIVAQALAASFLINGVVGKEKISY